MSEDEIDDTPNEAGPGDGVDDHHSAFGGSGFDPMRWRDDDLPPAAAVEVDDPLADGDGDWMPGEGAAPFEEEGESLAELEGAVDAAAFLDDGPAASAAPPETDAHPEAGPGAAPGPAPAAAQPAASEPQAAAEPTDEYPSFEIPREERQAAPAVSRHGGRATPHDLNAERCVLGALLLSPDRLVEVTDVLKPNDFFDRRNRIILDAMIQIDGRGQPVDLVHLVANLRAVGALADAGGAGYLAEVQMAVPTSAHLKHHAVLVAETSKLRSLIGAAGGIIERSFETPPDPDEVQTLIDESEASIFSIASRGEARGAAAVSSILDDVFHAIEAQSGRGEHTGIPSGFYDLDEVLGGFNPGEMTVIAARPAMGKTAFVLNLMDHAATHRAESLGYEPSVLFFSLEMGRQSIVQRMLVARAGVESHRLRQGRLHDREYQDLVEAAGVLKGARLFIDDTPGLSIMALRSRARRVKAEHGLDMIVIDYLQLLSAKAESRQQEISMISRSLKELSRELEVPLITLAQLSRSVESREEKRPQLSDLRESGSIEQDADVVMMLYRPEYYFPVDENKGKAEVLVVKHRNGATGTVELQFQGSMLRFSNREPSMSEPITGL